MRRTLTLGKAVFMKFLLLLFSIMLTGKSCFHETLFLLFSIMLTISVADPRPWRPRYLKSDDWVVFVRIQKTGKKKREAYEPYLKGAKCYSY